jgi:hypothetical protein
MGIGHSLRIAPRCPERFDLCSAIFKPAEGIEQPAMSCGVDQCTLVMLAVDLNKGAPELLEHLHAYGLVVDERPGAAVGKLHAAKNEFILGGNIVGSQLRPDRVIARDVENGCHLALLEPLAHQSLIAPPAQRQRKSVEQNRLAGPRLTCEDGKAVGKINVETVDQNDVADG